MTILNLELQEMGFMKVQGQQIIPKPIIISAKTVLTLVENSTELGLVVIWLVLSVYNTNLAFLDVVVGMSFINNNILVCLLSVTVSVWTLVVSSDNYDFLLGGYDMFPAEL